MILCDKNEMLINCLPVKQSECLRIVLSEVSVVSRMPMWVFGIKAIIL